MNTTQTRARLPIRDSFLGRPSTSFSALPGKTLNRRTTARSISAHSKHPKAQAWLAKHPRFQLYSTPTSSSRLNLVERWFRELTDTTLRRGVFHSVPDPIDSIQDYLDPHNDDPRPYVWTATAHSILAKVARGRIALERIS
ncbi:hypothetical protein RW1_041_00640 [Rhodococcus wratislaviensis NBRC 100605]|uniref:Tc1-like transposase DDE domain-containing protein n=1 Tax=Rhodococcus wratislaviensis NBRC 100605 TaxID=1219028 RepID=X0PW74_RHOWR|nr:hypothetical protein RW1_041_00640 [Rhodococcus wratislaviensis NBRC 100605]